MLGFFDIFAAFLMFMGNTWMPGWLHTFVWLFILFKGISSIFHIPIWMGPVSFFAGIIDLMAGLTMYFSGGYAGVLAHMATVAGVMLTLKGGFTVVFGLFAR